MKIRNNFEAFLCWYVPIALIHPIVVGFGLPYSLRGFLIEKSSASMTTILMLTSLSACLPAVVAAVWLWRQQHQNKKIQILWTLFGLVTSLWAVGLYIVIIALHHTNATNDIMEQDSSATEPMT